MSTNPSNGPATAQGESLTGNPYVLVGGGIALGVLIGMLIPRSQKERELLDATGRQLADKVTGTVQAVKEAGKAEFDALLPSRDDAKDRVGALFGNLVDAAKGATQKA
ncbi:hypothetical protein [Sphingomonas kyeonggiensis]|uniref:Uncharacterized protein n=1 Tax=Sphingomonas kyeonggiensis TaxID=1268553 RepID=A0A7W6NVT5_9SPHN|nr:hypothetical protein [Sphingomonas kyeonggiensis]MBB4097792.1 hypothetical protein [Sphingomonas kyeonggiensis]